MDFSMLCFKQVCSNGTVDFKKRNGKKKAEKSYHLDFTFPQKSTYCSQGIQHSTYFMLPSLLSVVDLVRGAKMFPGIHPSAAGEWSLAG